MLPSHICIYHSLILNGVWEEDGYEHGALACKPYVFSGLSQSVFKHSKIYPSSTWKWAYLSQRTNVQERYSDVIPFLFAFEVILKYVMYFSLSAMWNLDLFVTEKYF